MRDVFSRVGQFVNGLLPFMIGLPRTLLLFLQLFRQRFHIGLQLHHDAIFGRRSAFFLLESRLQVPDAKLNDFRVEFGLEMRGSLRLDVGFQTFRLFDHGFQFLVLVQR